MSDKRVNSISSHLTSAGIEQSPVVDESLPLPPIVSLKQGQLFPTYPEVLEASKKYGGVFTYVLGNNRRMTFVTDKAAYRHVFFARDNKDVHLDSAKLAYHWFGIQKDLARDYTRPGLDKTREAMSYGKMKKTSEKVGTHIITYLSKMPNEGQADLWDIAMLTFVPVVQNLFGKETFEESKCPMIANTLWKYDSDFRRIANGMPRKMFPDHDKYGKELDQYFKKSIENNLHLRPDAEINCPVLKARLSVIPEGKFTDDERARFCFSVFWASQGNTIPATFWIIGLIANDERVKRKVINELKARNERKSVDDPDYFNFEDCEYIQCCVKETLRLKVANVTLRNVVNTINVTTTDGKSFKVPKGDEITVSSFVQHHDDRTYEDPEEFNPDRWLPENGGSRYTDFDWFPFGAGTNMCSGRHLAQFELSTMTALVFSQFDITLAEKLPEEEWQNVVAMVGPKKRSLKYNFKRHNPIPMPHRV